MVEDKLLIYRCRQGSRAAFRRIYEKYESDLRTLAANLLGDTAAAEDVVHDVFVSFLKVVDGFELRGSLAGYLKTCVANRARDYMRKTRGRSAAAADAERAARDDGPLRLVMQSEQLQKVGLAMSHLPYEQREAIVLYLSGRMRFRAIAKLQRVSVKTAHSRYRAGVDKLKSVLNIEVGK